VLRHYRRSRRPLHERGENGGTATPLTSSARRDGRCGGKCAGQDARERILVDATLIAVRSEKRADLHTTLARLRYICPDGAKGPMPGDRPGFILIAV